MSQGTLSLESSSQVLRRYRMTFANRPLDRIHPRKGLPRCEDTALAWKFVDQTLVVFTRNLEIARLKLRGVGDIPISSGKLEKWCSRVHFPRLDRLDHVFEALL